MFLRIHDYFTEREMIMHSWEMIMQFENQGIGLMRKLSIRLLVACIQDTADSAVAELANMSDGLSHHVWSAKTFFNHGQSSEIFQSYEWADSTKCTIKLGYFDISG